MPERFGVEVVFALPDRQRLIEVEVGKGATVADVIEVAGIRDEFAGVDLDALQRGIWGQIVQDDHPVNPGDRVEIYRPLEIEPREARRLRATRASDSAPGRDESH